MTAGGQPYPKLPFWETVRLSYSSYFAGFAEVLRVCWGWLVLIAIMMGLTSWQEWSQMAPVLTQALEGHAPQVSLPMKTMVLGYAAAAVELFAGASIAVAWHRFLILREQPGLSGANAGSRELWRYVGLAVMISLFSFALPAAVMLLPLLAFAPTTAAPVQLGPALGLMLFVLTVAGTAFMLRASLLLPARAVGNPGLTFRQAWDRTRGNTWRLFWGLILTTIPLLLVMEIALLVVIAVTGLPTAEDGGTFALRMTASNVIFNLYYLLILPVGIGFLSHAYLHFFRGGLPQR